MKKKIIRLSFVLALCSIVYLVLSTILTKSNKKHDTDTVDYIPVKSDMEDIDIVIE